MPLLPARGGARRRRGQLDPDAEPVSSRARDETAAGLARCSSSCPHFPCARRSRSSSSPPVRHSRIHLQYRRQRRCRTRPPARSPRGLAARDRRRPRPTRRRGGKGFAPRGPHHLRRDLGDYRGPRGPRSRAQLRGALLRRRARGGGDGRRGLRGRGLGGTPKRPTGPWRGSGRDPRPLRSCRGGRRRLRRRGAGGVSLARGGSTARQGRTGGGRAPVARRWG